MVLIGELEDQLEVEGNKLLAAIAEFAGDKEGSDQVLVEIRQGVGGEEAALWAQTLLRMILRFCERRRFAVEELNVTPSRGGDGIKECVIAVSGRGAERALELEAGVHRVQRVSPTDSKNRVHTSAASIAVLAQAEEVDLELSDSELKVESFTSGGKGGQHANRSLTAVRITHIPTGISASSSTRSKQQNLDAARKVLAARLAERARAAEESAVDQARLTQIGSGDRSAKTRTYNYPESRVTDHRISLTVHRLDAILDGQLELLHEPLRQAS